MRLVGTGAILCGGGVRATAALTYGLFDTPRAHVLTNPDNAYEP
ncbi:hypothetical protein J4E08_15440 [Sagittula sp. NFXS13]